MSKKNELATKEAQELAATSTMPADLIRDQGRGAEAIGPNDVRPPRLLICQAGSPQRKEGDPRQIEGLQELDMFNNLSGEIYGRGPVQFSVIKALPTRYIQFAPMSEGGGVIDFNVSPNDPRTQFTNGEDGKRVPPIAMKFRDFLVWLPSHQEPVIISMKSTHLKVADQLIGKMRIPLKGELINLSLKGQILANPPTWARTFSITTVMTSKDNQSWGTYNLKTDGVTPFEIRDLCYQLSESYDKKNVIVDHETETETTDDGTDFDTEKLDDQAQGM